MLSETDKYLVDKIRDGDYPAFETLFKCHYDSLTRIAILYVQQEEVAEDIVQDLFVKIWEDPSCLNTNVSLKGYLGRSVYNSCINYILRKQHKHRTIDQTAVNQLNDALRATPEDSPDTALLIYELSSAIEDAVSQLPSECGKIFRMSREEGLSHKEIAKRLSISGNTVKVQIYRALSKINDAISEFR